MCAQRFGECAHLVMAPLILLCLEQSTHLYVFFLADFANVFEPCSFGFGLLH